MLKLNRRGMLVTTAIRFTALGDGRFLTSHRLLSHQ
jgi:hypothetical protein